MQSLKTMCWLVVLGLSLVSASRLADACPVCINSPQKTVADFLIESPCVVFARENSDQPFSYAPVEVVKGNIHGKQIDLFVDTSTRKILAADAELVVLLAEDVTDGSWRSLGQLDPMYAAVVRRIIALTPDWQGKNGQQRRVEFFAKLFGHENPAVYEQAYLEMGRAPYGFIRQFSRIVPRDQIEPILTRRQYIGWRSLAILMLAHGGEVNGREYIADSFRHAARFRLTTNLAAWAAASIELEGEDAIVFIENQYFRNVERTVEELTEVVKALSMHGTEGHTQLRDQIVASYGVLLDVYPDMAPFVARDLLAWKRFELIQQLSTIEATHANLDYAAKKTCRQYLQFTAASNTLHEKTIGSSPANINVID